jgi:hypothetical protein
MPWDVPFCYCPVWCGRKGGLGGRHRISISLSAAAPRSSELGLPSLNFKPARSPDQGKFQHRTNVESLTVYSALSSTYCEVLPQHPSPWRWPGTGGLPIAQRHPGTWRQAAGMWRHLACSSPRQPTAFASRRAAPSAKCTHEPVKGGDGVRSPLTTCRTSQDRCVKEGGQHRPGRAHIKSRVHVSLCYRRGEFCRRSLGFAPAWLLLSVRALLLEGDLGLIRSQQDNVLKKPPAEERTLGWSRTPTLPLRGRHPPAGLPRTPIGWFIRGPKSEDSCVDCRQPKVKCFFRPGLWGEIAIVCITVSCRSCKSTR